MLVLARRVKEASVIVDEKTVSSIRHGLLLYVGVSLGDGNKECEYYAKKVSNLRIFDGEESEVSVKEINGEILSVSQFTLSADTKKGNRPSYLKAMSSENAIHVFNYFNECLKKESGIDIKTGVFGADMTIPAIDDGPFTILISQMG